MESTSITKKVHFHRFFMAILINKGKIIKSQRSSRKNPNPKQQAGNIGFARVKIFLATKTLFTVQ